MNLIEKNAVLAEINKLEIKNSKNSNDFNLGAATYLGMLKHFINTLEVKEVDEIPARIEVNKYHNRFISSWAGLCQYDNFRIGEEIKILLPKNKAKKGDNI